MKKLVILAIFGISLLIGGCTQQQVSPQQEKDFMAKYQRGTVVVYFWDKSCRACQLQNTELEAAKQSMDFPLVRIIPNDATITRYNLEAFPTILIFHNGKVAKRFEGVAYRNQILTEIEFIKKEVSEL